MEILNTEFLFLKYVQSSLQPEKKNVDCWKSGQPIKSTVHKFAPSHTDLLNRVANSLSSRYFKFFKMACTKTTPKNLVVKNKQLKRCGGKDGREKTPWEAKGWTQQQWINWHQQRQPDSSGSRVTLNPSWYLGKGMKFSLGG